MLPGIKLNIQRESGFSIICRASCYHKCSRYQRTLARVNPRKAAGPDNIPGHVLRDCTGELADVLNDIFNISLSQATVPRCFKTSTIVPIAKKPVLSCLNGYRSVALTTIVMKCFEQLIKPHITATLPALIDLLQFAYHPNHSTEDALTTTLHSAITHLDICHTPIDFSSVFNTIIPQRLLEKLHLLGLNTTHILGERSPNPPC